MGYFFSQIKYPGVKFDGNFTTTTILSLADWLMILPQCPIKEVAIGGNFSLATKATLSNPPN